MVLRKILQILGNLTYESQTNPPQPLHPLPPPPPLPPPLVPPHPLGPIPHDCDNWYIWAAVIVVLLATIALAFILVYFCRQRKGRRSSLDAIISNMELHNISTENRSVPTTVLHPNNKVIPNGGNIIVIQPNKF